MFFLDLAFGHLSMNSIQLTKMAAVPQFQGLGFTRDPATGRYYAMGLNAEGAPPTPLGNLAQG